MKVINAIEKMETGGRRVNTSQKGTILNSVARKITMRRLLLFFTFPRLIIILLLLLVCVCVLGFEGGKEVTHPGVEEKHP